MCHLIATQRSWRSDEVSSDQTDQTDDLTLSPPACCRSCLTQQTFLRIYTAVMAGSTRLSCWVGSGGCRAGRPTRSLRRRSGPFPFSFTRSHGRLVVGTSQFVSTLMPSTFLLSAGSTRHQARRIPP
jgi:hypothetical protein